MDQKQSELVERYQESKLVKQLDKDDNYESESDDELLELLEEDDQLAKYREARIQQLSKEFKKIDRTEAEGDGPLGSVIDIKEEKEIMEIVTHSEVALVHFYQPEFTKCEIMNKRLSVIAEKYFNLKVLTIKAEAAPFLVSKLSIKVLPFVVIYKNGKEINRSVGFEKFGNDPNNVTIESLEQFLYANGITNRRIVNQSSIKSRLKPTKEDSDDELDI